MSPKKANMKHSLEVFTKECKEIGNDVFFTYKNFLHWSMSRVLISVWGILLGIIVTLPIFLFAIIVGTLDGIDWLEIVKYSLNGEDPAHSGLIISIASHPYSLVLMIGIIFTAIISFVFASMYSNFLLSRLSFKYLRKKKLEYKKNLYFSTKYIKTFLALFCWNTVYILPFFFISILLALGLYFLYASGFISFTVISSLVFLLVLAFIILMSYVSYRIIFGYIILANTHKSHGLKPARFYLRKSIDITKKRGYIKFIIIAIVYAAIALPFQSGEKYMKYQITDLKETIAFRTGIIGNIASEDMAYYEYLSRKYESLSDEEIVEKIVSLSRMKVVYFFFTYFLFSGSFVLIMTSFYKRVLIKK